MWLKAAFYYNKHFQAVKNVICQLDRKTLGAIRKCQQFNNKQVADLHTIQANYRILADGIDELQVKSIGH